MSFEPATALAAGRAILLDGGLPMGLRAGARVAAIIGIVAVILLAVVVFRLTRRRSSIHDPPGTSPDERP